MGVGLCQPRLQKGESILMGGAFMEVRMDKVRRGLGRVGAASSPWLVGLEPRTSKVRTAAGRLWGLLAAWWLGSCLPHSWGGCLCWLTPESCLGSTTVARGQASQW